MGLWRSFDDEDGIGYGGGGSALPLYSMAWNCCATNCCCVGMKLGTIMGALASDTGLVPLCDVVVELCEELPPTEDPGYTGEILFIMKAVVG